eukprot:2563643-Prymnesium_polylepis.1
MDLQWYPRRVVHEPADRPVAVRRDWALGRTSRKRSLALGVFERDGIGLSRREAREAHGGIRDDCQHFSCACGIRPRGLTRMASCVTS